MYYLPLFIANLNDFKIIILNIEFQVKILTILAVKFPHNRSAPDEHDGCAEIKNPDNISSIIKLITCI